MNRHLAAGPASLGQIQTVCGLTLTPESVGGLPANETDFFAVIAEYKNLPPCPVCERRSDD